MPFKWRDYITLADNLTIPHATDSELRSSVSRAYYGCFGTLRRYCRNNKLITPQEDSGSEVHWKVINSLLTSTDPDEFLIGEILNNLRKERNKADYRLDYVTSFKKSQEIVEDAKDLFKTFDNMLQ